MQSLERRLLEMTERFLTRVKRRRIETAARRKRRPAFLEWIYTFLGAIVVILILNEYLFQFYVIPSGSMKYTLLVHDRISVNKLIFGPELLPGELKMKGFEKPVHGDVVIFKNPSYHSKGPLFDIAQRYVFMLTLSLVNLDKGPTGGPAVHYLIKRVVATGGDRIRIDPGNGSMEIRPAGTAGWKSEARFKRMAELHYSTVRIFSPRDYERLRHAAKAYVYSRAGLPITKAEIEAADSLPSFYDYKSYEEDRFQESYEVHPHNRGIGSAWRMFENGWYIPRESVFPMGDNRDDSRDGRYFGPVSLQTVLGRASFRFWPLWRIGSLR